MDRPARRAILREMTRAPTLLLALSLALTAPIPAPAQPRGPDSSATPTAPTAPAWSDGDIASSRTQTPGAREWPAAPQWVADPMNVFVVLQAGGHVVHLLDGDRFKTLGRIDSQHALHGAPRFSPDGRHAFIAADDGWITRLDLWNLRVAGRVRVGLALRDFALSSDGRWLLAVNEAPHTVVLLDAELGHVKTFATRTHDGRPSAGAQAVHDVAARRAFVLTLRDAPELWEISYDPGAPPIYDGLVHDYKMGEAIAKPGYHNIRRTPLEEPLDDFVVAPNPAYLVAATRPQADGATRAVVINLDVRRRIVTLPIGGAPAPASGVGFDWQGVAVLAIPNAQDGTIGVIDSKTWQAIRDIPTGEAQRVLRSHAATPFLWVGAASGVHDTPRLIDTRTLSLVDPAPGALGRVIGPVEFTRDGRFALVRSRSDTDALIVLDATTLAEVARVPVNQPMGAFNLGNRIASGTSRLR